MNAQKPQELNPEIWSAIRMGPNDRGVLIGKTGGGKTTLARFLIEDQRKPFSVVWNPKNSESIGDWRGHTRLETLRECQDCDDPRIIYTPDPFHAEDDQTQRDLFFWIYERKHTRFYIDEATSVQYGGGRIPRHLNAVINRGRERGVSTLTATQRPSGVPLNILSESEHYYVFKVLMPQDRARIEQVTGITFEDQASLEDFEFFYFNTSRGVLPRKIRINREWLKYGTARDRARAGATAAR
jgi:hypothetical protein